jgi:hypothetical protein
MLFYYALFISFCIGPDKKYLAFLTASCRWLNSNIFDFGRVQLASSVTRERANSVLITVAFSVPVTIVLMTCKIVARLDSGSRGE